MLVKCEQCGYENFPQHRFCGMCAAELRLPGPPGSEPGATPAPAPRRIPVAAPVAAPRAAVGPRIKEAVQEPVSGPSFLGLGNEPAETRNLSYLLEDEPPRHRGKYVFALLLLVVALAIVGWHWREDLVSRLSLMLGGKTQASSSTTTATPDAASGPAAVNAGSPADKESSGSGGQGDTPAPAAQEQSPPSAFPAAPGGTDSNPPQSENQSSPEQPQTSDSSSAPAAKSDDSGESVSQPAPGRKASKARAQAATAATQAADLEAEGEKYLYGNGVRENCTKARTNLLAAAEHSNAQAQNVLGTMYATGHCATRDLPTAYRWFSRSLRKDPSNTRIEQDLKVLWNQMTPEEKQLALKNER